MGSIAVVVLATLGLGAFYAAIFALQRRQTRAQEEAASQWLAAWRERGWRVTQTSAMEHSLEGSIDGVAVRWEQRVVEHEVGGESKLGVVCEASAASPVALGDLTVTSENALSRLGRSLGAQDLELGDPAFDRAFVVRASDPSTARRVLGPIAREALCGALSRVGAVTLRGGRVSLLGSDVAAPASVEDMLREVAAVARALGR